MKVVGILQFTATGVILHRQHRGRVVMALDSARVSPPDNSRTRNCRLVNYVGGQVLTQLARQGIRRVGSGGRTDRVMSGSGVEPGPKEGCGSKDMETKAGMGWLWDIGHLHELRGGEFGKFTR